MEPAATATFLSGLPLFRHAPPESLHRIAEATVRVELAARDYLFSANESAAELHVVLSGRLEIVSPGGEVLREIGPGSVLGELAVVTDSSRSASARARRDCELLSINGPRFQALLRADPALGFALLRQLAVQLRESAGLGLVTAAPGVFTVVPLVPADQLTPLWTDLVDAFAELGPTAALGPPADNARSFGPSLARLEAGHEHVLLRADGPEHWRSFAIRQADRVVVVAGASPPPRDHGLAGVELVFSEPLTAADTAEWLDAFAPRAHHHVHLDRRAGARRAARRMTGRGLGVVLSGGGARGGAHIGALEILAGTGLEIDKVGGCSIGSFVGVMAASGWDAKRMRDVWADELVRRSPFGDFTVPRVSLIRGRRVAAMLERVFGDVALEELPRAAFTVSADLITSELVVHRRGQASQAVGASMAIPGLAPPQRQGGRLLVDGGILNNLPVDVMASSGEGPVVAVDVMRRPDAPGDDGASHPLPGIMETLTRSTALGSVERAERNRALAALTIVPQVQGIALRDFAQIDRAIEAGRVATAATLDSGGLDLLRAALGT